MRAVARKKWKKLLENSRTFYSGSKYDIKIPNDYITFTGTLFANQLLTSSDFLGFLRILLLYLNN